MFHRSNLVINLDVNNPFIKNRVDAITKSFMAKGFHFNIAHGNALQSLDYMVSKQAMVLTYMDVFWFIGMMFFICVPFVMMVKDRKGVTVDFEEGIN